MKKINILLSILLMSSYSFCATFIVTSATGDAATSGSLAWAITQANSSGGADIISFSGIGAGTTSISGTNLPAITGEVNIDGTTWPGYTAGGAHLNVTLNCTGGGCSPNPLLFNAGSDGSTIQGLSITGNVSSLVEVNGANNVTVQNNYFQVGSDGSTRFSCGGGCSANASVLITSADGTTVDDNIFQLDVGQLSVDVSTGATNTVISNNNFGVAIDGTTNLGGTANNSAVRVEGLGIDEVEISGNIIGFTNNTGGDGGGRGIDINSGTNIDILNNNIGILGDGETAASMVGNAISLEGGPSNILIDGNLIGNGTQAIQVNDAANLTITNNTIGETTSGVAAGMSGSNITLTTSNATITGNILANSAAEGIWMNGDNASADMSNNAISCNRDGADEGEGIRIDNTEATAAPTVSVNDGNTVSGTSVAGARIDIYRKDAGSSCANCEGEIFMANVTADGSGNWSYTHSSGWATNDPAGQISATATSGGITSEFADGGTGDGCTQVAATVSIEFYRFNCVKGINENHLSWFTAIPENEEYFLVERANGSFNFEVIGKFYGNTSGKFNFIDDKPLSGDNYYRIKQVDENDITTYSEILKVDNSDLNKLNLVKIYPNPTKNKLAYIKLDNSLLDQNISIKVFSSLGKLIIEDNAFSGSYFDLSEQQEGTYLFVIITDLEVITVPVIIK